MGEQFGGRQQLSISAELPAGAGQPATPEQQPSQAAGYPQPVRQLDDTVARLLAELGRRIGELEVLSGQWPEHERRVSDALSEYEAKTNELASELRGHASGLERLFLDHKHDVPEPAPEPEHKPDLVDKADNPITAIDAALGDAIPTPAAPEGAAPVQAPKAFKYTKAYRSRLHKGR